MNILISNKNKIQVHSDQPSAYDAWKGIKFCNYHPKQDIKKKAMFTIPTQTIPMMLQWDVANGFKCYIKHAKVAIFLAMTELQNLRMRLSDLQTSETSFGSLCSTPVLFKHIQLWFSTPPPRLWV